MTLRTHAADASAGDSTVDLLILGAGWTYTFLKPLLDADDSGGSGSNNSNNSKNDSDDSTSKNEGDDDASTNTVPSNLESNPSPARRLTYAATTTTGHDGTIAFKFDPDASDAALRDALSVLPRARVVLITFPIVGRGPTARLVETYASLDRGSVSNIGGSGVGVDSGVDVSGSGCGSPTRWIQLGSTSLWTAPTWNDRHSPTDASVARGQAEDELLALGGCVLNLAGLYGGTRTPRNWLGRVAGSKDRLAAKGALHVVHGVDVARAVVAVVRRAVAPPVTAEEASDNDNNNNKPAWDAVRGRWIVCDLNVYDWWELAWAWGGGGGGGGGGTATATTTVATTVAGAGAGAGAKGLTGEAGGNENEEGKRYRRWVGELMREHDVRALPRDGALLGRKLDGREFWETLGLLPVQTMGR